MLPEFLFPVGHSMQDIAREDFSLLNGDKDVCPPAHLLHPPGDSPSPLPLALPSVPTARPAGGALLQPLKTPTPDHGLAYDGIKMEDSRSRSQSPVDLFPTHPATWQQHPMNSHEHAHLRHQLPTAAFPLALDLPPPPPHRLASAPPSRLLLQGSDDPLISRGATSVPDDEPPAEFSSLMAAAQNGGREHHQQRPMNGCSSLIKQQLKVKASLMSSQQQHHQHQQQQQQQLQQPGLAAGSAAPKARTPKPKKKGALKLRFHHQALPPEYLSHYEATQGQALARPQKKEVDAAKLDQAAKLLPAKSAHENVRSWLQKIAELQRAAHQDPNHCHKNHINRTPDVRTPPPPTAAPVAPHYDRVLPPAAPAAPPAQISGHPRKVVQYSDLPYMGEITLDNTKPRRGRKPKKADICHLIYKNYGTIFPGTPRGHLRLEKEAKRPGSSHKQASAAEQAAHSIEEPLNLCLRDQSGDSYSISSGEDHAGPGSLDSPDSSNCPTPVATAADADTDQLLASNLKLSLPGLGEPPAAEQPPGVADTARAVPASPQPSWTPAGSLLLHPMSLYYQRLIESGSLIAQGGQALGFPIETIQKDNQLALKIPIPSGLFLAPKQEKPSPALAPDYPEPLSTPSSVKSEVSVATTASSANHPPHQPPQQQQQQQMQQQQQATTQKRKRSAIFIPPMPSENPSNPPSEVSICKFKFTGGARPTLQEKKMLSVDSDGNYRYYSGTGDKAMRGYEFFPRESLQQSGLVPGASCAGAFLNAAGERVALDLPPPSTGLSNELLQIPDSPPASLLLPLPLPTTIAATVASQPPPAATNATPAPGSYCCVSPLAVPPSTLRSRSGSPNSVPATPTGAPHSGGHVMVAATTEQGQRPLERKKKSRRSTQREKLEKTFKEKGFLIQTQQLESAEGATYCKFRQLKKFTRYLFRNWKDYLPDELQRPNEVTGLAEGNPDQLRNHNNNSNNNNNHIKSSPAMQFAKDSSNAPEPESFLANHGLDATRSRLLRQSHDSLPMEHAT